MAGKHRKSSRPAAAIAAVAAPGGLAAAAVTLTSLSTAVVTGTTVAAVPGLDLLAVITPANSTAQIFAGAVYYGTDYTKSPASDTYGPQVTVPFFEGPQGIANAIKAADADPTDNKSVVLASGWGAGQTGTALGTLSPSDLDEIDYVILDNNSNRAGGGFWTTYAAFAPLLATSAEPTPNDLDVPILDVAYQYNINSDAPVDPLNPFALGNSLAAYVYGYGGQSSAVIPDEAVTNAKDQSEDAQHYHYIVDENGGVIDRIPVDGNITYVTVKSTNLPLTRPLRLLPGGDILADALDPTLTELVNAGYNDGKGVPGDEAIPVDPGVTRPMQPGSSLTGLGGVPGSVVTGLQHGASTAVDDVTNPTNLVTKPLAEVGKLPVLSTLTSSLTNSSLTQATTTASIADKTSLPSLKKPAGTSSGIDRPLDKPLKKFTDRINDAVGKVTGGLQNKAGNDSSAGSDTNAGS